MPSAYSRRFKMYKIINKHPVARFYYTGTHTHPVRRTVLLIEVQPNFIRGYELREGSITREFKDAPIKSYTRDKIANATPYERRFDVKARKRKGPATYKRQSLLDLVVEGV